MTEVLFERFKESDCVISSLKTIHQTATPQVEMSRIQDMHCFKNFVFRAILMHLQCLLVQLRYFLKLLLKIEFIQHKLFE